MESLGKILQHNNNYQAARSGCWLALAAFATVFLVKLYHARSKFARLRAQGAALPEWSPIFGHLLFASRIMAKLPKGAHGHYMPIEIRKLYPEITGMFYLDLWPLATSFLVIISPEVAQDLVSRAPTKDLAFLKYMESITGGNDMICAEGKEWKHWREMFSPGFNPKHIMSLVPDMIGDILTFRQILHEHAKKGDMFQLEGPATNLTLDVIGRITLDTDLGNLRRPHEMISAFRSTISLARYENAPIIEWPNPFRGLMLRRNTRIMNNWLRPFIKQRYTDKSSSTDVKNTRSIIGLAFKSHKEESTEKNDSSFRSSTSFLDAAMAQVKLFLFAGHDTTSGTLCYAYHMLSKHPSTLASIRAELDSVLGAATSTAVDRLTEKPQLLNQLTYMTAVLREVLRLFSPIGLMRDGRRDIILTDPVSGAEYPTEGYYIWAVQQAIHRNPAYWHRPNEFLPERWLVDENDPLYKGTRNAWRPFEKGARGCIGQELAMVEMKLCLALTIREFDIKSVYDEWDRAKGQGAIDEIDGEIAWQFQDGAAHPRERMPVRIRVRG